MQARTEPDPAESPSAPRERWRDTRYLTVSLALLSVVNGACLVGDDKCGDHQRQIAGTYSCECEPGYVASPLGYGCDACGANEDSAAGKCVCKTGFTRAVDGAACQPVVGSVLGSSCSGSQPCVGDNGFCATAEPSPYCTTTGCTRSTDCEVNWRCDKSGAQSYCRKPPSGLGEACSGSSDCAGKEATYCSSTIRACLVNDCAQAKVSCPNGSFCCDLTMFVGQSLCLSAEALSNGNCPFSSMPPVMQ